MRFTFRKEERLRSRKLFDELMRSGHAVHEGRVRLVGKLTDLPGSYPVQAAFSVPKRNMKRAVDRNRIKRLMRECYRHRKPDLYERLSGTNSTCALLFIYHGRELASLNTMQAIMERLLLRWTEEALRPNG